MYASLHPRDQNCVRRPRAPARETSGYSSCDPSNRAHASPSRQPLWDQKCRLSLRHLFKVAAVSHTRRQGFRAVKKVRVQGFLSNQCTCLVSFDFSVFLFCWHLCILSVCYAFDTLVIFVNLGGKFHFTDEAKAAQSGQRLRSRQ